MSTLLFLLLVLSFAFNHAQPDVSASFSILFSPSVCYASAHYPPWFFTATSSGKLYIFPASQCVLNNTSPPSPPPPFPFPLPASPSASPFPPSPSLPPSPSASSSLALCTGSHSGAWSYWAPDTEIDLAYLPQINTLQLPQGQYVFAFSTDRVNFFVSPEFCADAPPPPFALFTSPPDLSLSCYSSFPAYTFTASSLGSIFLSPASACNLTSLPVNSSSSSSSSSSLSSSSSSSSSLGSCDASLFVLLEIGYWNPLTTMNVSEFALEYAGVLNDYLPPGEYLMVFISAQHETYLSDPFCIAAPLPSFALFSLSSSSSSSSMCSSSPALPLPPHTFVASRPGVLYAYPAWACNMSASATNVSSALGYCDTSVSPLGRMFYNNQYATVDMAQTQGTLAGFLNSGGNPMYLLQGEYVLAFVNVEGQLYLSNEFCVGAPPPVGVSWTVPQSCVSAHSSPVSIATNSTVGGLFGVFLSSQCTLLNTSSSVPAPFPDPLGASSSPSFFATCWGTPIYDSVSTVSATTATTTTTMTSTVISDYGMVDTMIVMAYQDATQSSGQYYVSQQINTCALSATFAPLPSSCIPVLSPPPAFSFFSTSSGYIYIFADTDCNITSSTNSSSSSTYVGQCASIQYGSLYYNAALYAQNQTVTVYNVYNLPPGTLFRYAFQRNYEYDDTYFLSQTFCTSAAPNLPSPPVPSGLFTFQLFTDNLCSSAFPAPYGSVYDLPPSSSPTSCQELPVQIANRHLYAQSSCSSVGGSGVVYHVGLSESSSCSTIESNIDGPIAGGSNNGNCARVTLFGFIAYVLIDCAPAQGQTTIPPPATGFPTTTLAPATGFPASTQVPTSDVFTFQLFTDNICSSAFDAPYGSVNTVSSTPNGCQELSLQFAGRYLYAQSSCSSVGGSGVVYHVGLSESSSCSTIESNIDGPIAGGSNNGNCVPVTLFGINAYVLINCAPAQGQTSISPIVPSISTSFAPPPTNAAATTQVPPSGLFTFQLFSDNICSIALAAPYGSVYDLTSSSSSSPNSCQELSLEILGRHLYAESSCSSVGGSGVVYHVGLSESSSCSTIESNIDGPIAGGSNSNCLPVTLFGFNAYVLIDCAPAQGQTTIPPPATGSPATAQAPSSPSPSSIPIEGGYDSYGCCSDCGTPFCVNYGCCGAPWRTPGCIPPTAPSTPALPRGTYPLCSTTTSPAPVVPAVSTSFAPSSTIATPSIPSPSSPSFFPSSFPSSSPSSPSTPSTSFPSTSPSFFPTPSPSTTSSPTDAIVHVLFTLQFSSVPSSAQLTALSWTIADDVGVERNRVNCWISTAPSPHSNSIRVTASTTPVAVTISPPSSSSSASSAPSVQTAASSLSTLLSTPNSPLLSSSSFSALGFVSASGPTFTSCANGVTDASCPFPSTPPQQQEETETSKTMIYVIAAVVVVVILVVVIVVVVLCLRKQKRSALAHDNETVNAIVAELAESHPHHSLLPSSHTGYPLPPPAYDEVSPRGEGQQSVSVSVSVSVSRVGEEGTHFTYADHLAVGEGRPGSSSVYQSTDSTHNSLYEI